MWVTLQLLDGMCARSTGQSIVRQLREIRSLSRTVRLADWTYVGSDSVICVHLWLDLFIVSDKLKHIGHSRLCDHQRIRFQFPTIEHARTLNAALLWIRNIRFTLRECDLQTDPPTLFHFFFLHQRDPFSCKIEPLTRDQYAVLRFSVGHRRLKSFFNQRVSQQPVTELRSFKCRLKTLRCGEDIHTFLISELR